MDLSQGVTSDHDPEQPHRYSELIVQLLKDGITVSDIFDNDRLLIDTNVKKEYTDRTIVRLPLLLGENWLHWYECSHHHPSQMSSNSHMSHTLLPTIVSLSEVISDMIHLPPTHEEINNSRPNTSQNSHGSCSDLSNMVVHDATMHPVTYHSSISNNNNDNNQNAQHPAIAATTTSIVASNQLLSVARQCCYLCFDVVATANSTEPIFLTMKDMRDPIIPDSFSQTNCIAPANHNYTNHHWTVHLHRASSTRTHPPRSGDPPIRRRQSYQLQPDDFILFRKHDMITMIVQYQQSSSVSVTSQQQPLVALYETQPPPRLPLPPTTILNAVQSDEPDDTQLTSQDFEGTNHINDNDNNSEDGFDDEDEGIDTVTDLMSQPDTTIAPTSSETAAATVFHSAMDFDLSTQPTIVIPKTTTTTTTGSTVVDPSSETSTLLHLSPIQNSCTNNVNKDYDSDNDDDDDSTVDPRKSFKNKSPKEKTKLIPKSRKSTTHARPPLPSKASTATVTHKAVIKSTKAKQEQQQESMEPYPSVYSPDLLAATPTQLHPHEHTRHVDEIPAAMIGNTVDTPLKQLTCQPEMTDVSVSQNEVEHGCTVTTTTTAGADVAATDKNPIPHSSEVEIFETAVSTLPPPPPLTINDDKDVVHCTSSICVPSNEEVAGDKNEETVSAKCTTKEDISERHNIAEVDEPGPPLDLPNHPTDEHPSTPPKSTRRKRASTTSAVVPSTNGTSTSMSKRRRIEPGSNDRNKNDNDGATADIRILTTGFELDPNQRAMVRAIPGATLVEHIHDAHTATHIIATDGTTDIRRTCKLMIAICRSSNILTLDWLIDSSKQEKALDIAPYRIKHNATYCRALEQQYTNFSMRTTLRNIQHRSTLLFHRWYIHVCPKVAGQKAPSTNEFQYIIEAAGATYISAMKHIVWNNDNNNNEEEENDNGTGDRSVNILMITSDPPTKTQLTYIDKQTKSLLSSDPLMKANITMNHHHRTTTWFFHTVMTQEIKL